MQGSEDWASSFGDSDCADDTFPGCVFRVPVADRTVGYRAGWLASEDGRRSREQVESKSNCVTSDRSRLNQDRQRFRTRKVASGWMRGGMDGVIVDM